MALDITRKKTGILGFDKLCEGGLINDGIFLIMGNAGAGKTTFLLQFLYNGATKEEENGLYVSFESEPSDIYRSGKKMGMDFEELEKENKCFVRKFPTDLVVKDMQKQLLKIITQHNIQRVCFDPINVLSVDLPKEITLRRQLFEIFLFLKKLGICVLIAGEADEALDKGGAFSDEIIFSRYLADGIVELYSSGIGGSGDRAIRISKMRMTNHERGPVGMQITSSGLKILKT